jgi:hypothetical protein
LYLNEENEGKKSVLKVGMSIKFYSSYMLVLLGVYVYALLKTKLSDVWHPFPSPSPTPKYTSLSFVFELYCYKQNNNSKLFCFFVVW